jgi:hypothetical protein
MKYLPFLSLLICAQALFVVNPVETVPICVNENTVLSPVSDNQTIVTHIAWPITGPSFDGVVTVNDVPATGSPTILCMDCADPPCYPVTGCDPSTLYWSVRFDDLTVQPGRMILPDSLTLPPVLVTFYTPWAPSPSPSPTPTPTTSPSVAPSDSPPASTAHVIVSCDVCDKSAVVGLATVLAFILCGFVGFALYVRRRAMIVACPFCRERMSVSTVRIHLESCTEHGKHFEPIVVDRVKTVNTAIISILPAGAHNEDEIARPEAVQLTR